MAITKGDILLWQSLRDNGHLPNSPAVLEIGEANWYDAVDLPKDIPYVCDRFEQAKEFYRFRLGYSKIVSIDMNGTEAALRLDLNEPVWWDNTEHVFNQAQVFHTIHHYTKPVFDITINTGTTEHVFNQHQCFHTIHHYTKPGGLMVHSFPIAGWVNHGFYVYQPCLLEDLAFANRYALLYRGETEMDLGTQCHLAWRKTTDEPFKVPQQRRR